MSVWIMEHIYQLTCTSFCFSRMRLGSAKGYVQSPVECVKDEGHKLLTSAPNMLVWSVGLFALRQRNVSVDRTRSSQSELLFVSFILQSLTTIQGLTISRSIIYGNTATALTAKERETVNPEHTHRWTVAVRSAASEPDSDSVGGADDMGHFIKRVTFKLHETYPNPTRSKQKYSPPLWFLS